ncbi:hypothetical protein EDD16DRAFT_1522264 [Pisolithus croceorrhizus]|nr:hypothetical protein EDD16DRAFT_1522264 [Pisolithus croceorrhizus]KAI6133563.1 hypothetical protein EV401DRAFT_1883438 [Pisolithus croceorrhizus]KAI6165684.1 hypothetical protein EDD17DRAFT_1505713 [Pisolithus thermaeus]
MFIYEVIWCSGETVGSKGSCADVGVSKTWLDAGTSITCCETIRIKKIGGAFSRTTSYVFSNLSTWRSGGVNLSDVLAHANLSKMVALPLDASAPTARLGISRSMILIPPERASPNSRDEFIQCLPTLRSCERWLQWRDVENKVVKAGLENLPLMVQGACTSAVATAMGDRQVSVTVRTLRREDVFLMRSANWKSASEW